MTTEVIVKANHGRPVEVRAVGAGGLQIAPTATVRSGETRSFHVFDSHDLLIHEVQPVRAAVEPETFHQGLPVVGYRPQTDDAVARVNAMKADEERLLRKLDAMKDDPAIDPRWLAVGRTALEQAFMAINRSIFRPGRAETLK